MEFPITDLLSQAEGERGLLEHFHPSGLKCSRCGAGCEQGYMQEYGST